MSSTSTHSLLTAKVLTEPLYLHGSMGPVFCVRSRLVGAEAPENQPAVLLVPPFAEEMNCSRRFFTKLRNELILRGVSEVVLPDLYGTGDSAGEFNDARWQIWIRDLSFLANQLRTENSNRALSVVGVRAGCLLASELANNLDMMWNNIVFVNPERSGYDIIQLLLRARVVSRRFSGGSVETTKQLWHELDTGRSVDVGGYTINPSLAFEMKEKQLDIKTLMMCKTGHWIDLEDKPVASESATGYGGVTERSAVDTNVPSATLSRLASTEDQLERGDLQWIHYCLIDKPFWQLHEHEPKDETISAVAQCAAQQVVG